MSELSLKPKKARVMRGAKSAWWYDEWGCILLLIDAGGTEPIRVSIKRSALLRYLERSGR